MYGCSVCLFPFLSPDHVWSADSPSRRHPLHPGVWASGAHVQWLQWLQQVHRCSSNKRARGTPTCSLLQNDPVAVVDISRSSIWPGVLKLSSLHPTDNRLALLVAAPPASHLLCFVSCRSDYSPSVWFDCSNWRSQPLSPQRLPLASLPQAATAAPRPTFLSTKGEALLAPPQEAGGAGQASGLPCHLNVFHCLVPPCAQWANSSCTPVGQSSTVARTYGILNVIE